MATKAQEERKQLKEQLQTKQEDIVLLTQELEEAQAGVRLYKKISLGLVVSLVCFLLWALI